MVGVSLAALETGVPTLWRPGSAPLPCPRGTGCDADVSWVAAGSRAVHAPIPHNAITMPRMAIQIEVYSVSAQARGSSGSGGDGHVEVIAMRMVAWGARQLGNTAHRL